MSRFFLRDFLGFEAMAGLPYEFLGFWAMDALPKTNVEVSVPLICMVLHICLMIWAVVLTSM